MILLPPHSNLIAQAHNGSGKTTWQGLTLVDHFQLDFKPFVAGCPRTH